MRELPLIGLTVGDPAGVGPELVLRALSDEELAGVLRLVVVGPARLRPAGTSEYEGPSSSPQSGHSWLGLEGRGWKTGEVSREAGLMALSALRRGHELAQAGEVAALVTAPVSKAALHLAGEPVEGQTELLSRWCERPQAQMAVLAGPLRILLLTRHLPLREAIDAITTTSVHDHLVLFDQALRELGCPVPRIALAGLNPHAGESGLLGNEELELLAPAVAAACAEGIDAHGPVSPDSVFVEAQDGRYDGVLALYHDQAFIAAKLYGALEQPAVTWIAGLPYVRLSPSHGTAFDIAGSGRADTRGLFEALRQAAQLAQPAGSTAGSPG